MNRKKKGRYASVNGLNMYYAIHGTGRPLVLLHGGLSTIGTSFGKTLPSLSKTREVIAIEQQAHGHTADVDRPFPMSRWRTTAPLCCGSSRSRKPTSSARAWGAASHCRSPSGIRIWCANLWSPPPSEREGFHPGILEGIENLNPEDLAGSPFQEDYARTAPDPERWPTLIARQQQLEREFVDWPPEDIQSIKAPTLVIIRDSDVVRPEHAVEIFRLLGGGVAGDIAGLARSQLAVLPGTTHITLVDRPDWLLSMIGAFLDAPVPDAG